MLVRIQRIQGAVVFFLAELTFSRLIGRFNRIERRDEQQRNKYAR